MAEQDRLAPRGTQSMALTREIAAFQLSRNLPVLGHIDITTDVALSVDGARQAEAEGREAAALALRLAEESDAETLPSRFGPVRGAWRGDAYMGAASRNSLSYSGEWQLGQGGLVLPSGFGVLENRTARETFAGMFRGGVFSGLGVTEISRDGTTRLVGTFDDQGRFTKGAVVDAGEVAVTGIFSPGGRDLLREVPLPR